MITMSKGTQGHNGGSGTLLSHSLLVESKLVAQGRATSTEAHQASERGCNHLHIVVLCKLSGSFSHWWYFHGHVLSLNGLFIFPLSSLLILLDFSDVCSRCPVILLPARKIKLRSSIIIPRKYAWNVTLVSSPKCSPCSSVTLPRSHPNLESPPCHIITYGKAK